MELDPNLRERARTFFHVRSMLKWSAGRVAALLDVGPRMVRLWEAEESPIPDGRWRLFLHEVANELTLKRHLVSVVADDGFTLLDVTSDVNYVDHGVDHPSDRGVYVAMRLSRRSGEPEQYRQAFRLSTNEFALRAFDHWKSQLRLGLGAESANPAMFAAHRWLTRRALEAEAADPALRVLKDAIAAANREVEYAENDTDRRAKLDELDGLIKKLLKRIS